MSENSQGDLQLTEEQLGAIIGGTKGAGCVNCGCPECVQDIGKELFHKGQAQGFEILATAAAHGEQWHVADSYLEKRNDALKEAQNALERMQKRHSASSSSPKH